MQIVADADEGEALLQKFANARSAKQENAKNDVVLARLLDQLCVAAFSSGEVYMCGNSYLL